MTLRSPSIQLVLAAVSLFTMRPVLAETPPAASVRSLTLTDALAYATEHQPSLLAARERIAAAQAATQVPRAQWLPTVAATAQLIGGTANNSTASYLGSMVDLPRVGGTATNTTSFTPYVSTVAGVGLRQEVYDFGRVAALSAAADALVRVQEQQAGIVGLDLAFAVTNSFYAVQAAHAVLAAAEDAFTRSTVNRNFAAAGVAQGLRRPIDQTRAEADLARFDVGRVQARGALDSAETVFAAVVGVADQRLDVAGEPGTPQPLPELHHALQTALTQTPDVLAAQAALQAQQARTGAVASQLNPDLHLSATVSGRAGGGPTTTGETATGAGLLPYIPNYDAGLVFSWPLLDFTVLRQIKTEEQTENAFKDDVANTQLQVTASVQEAYVTAQVADEAIVSLDRSFQAAIANEKQAVALFQAGLSTSLELADAEYLRSDAQIQLAIGHFTQMQARARLARVIGGSI